MGADLLGARLLDEVKDDSLDVFLQRLRHSLPSRLLDLTHIPVIDWLLNIFVSPATTASRLTQTRHDIQQKHLPPVIEITSTSPCAGKTHILYYLTSLATLPGYLEGVPLHGKAGCIIFIDTDNRFSVPRLYQIMKQHIAACSTSAGLDVGSPAVEDAVQTALLHVHIFRPQTSASLLSTLQSIPAYLLGHDGQHTNFSHHRSVSAILIDSLSSFIHQDRVQPKEFAQRYKDIVSTLRKLQDQFDTPIVATTWSTAIPQRESYANQPPGVRSQLPYVWSNFIAVRLVVERDQVARFVEGMGGLEAWRQRKMRQVVVERGGFSGWVDRSAEEDWGSGTMDRVTVRGGGFFWFSIGGEGVVFEEWREG